ncbi:MAG: mandelate racemase/muconate lactonizing enzyme family protein [Burkholderiales bacterium]
MARIVRVDIGRRDYALVGEFKFFKGGARPSVMVRLTDDAGREGYGQAVPVETWTYETVESVATTLTHYLAPAMLGADPADLAGVHARMESAIRPSFSVGQPLAKAAIDLACHDLWGKAQGQPVCELLGGRLADEVRLSWTINPSSLAQAEKLLEEGRSQGYANFNIKLGPPQATAFDLELVRLVTRFSPAGFHWGDANTGYTLAVALEQAPKLADLGLRALESPLPPNRIRDYQRLKSQGALPILMDEGLVSAVEAEEFAALGMFDGIAMKVARCGGLWHAWRMVEVLRRAGLALYASGLTDPEFSLAASVQLFAAAGLTLPAALNGPQYLEGRGTADTAFRAVRDVIRVPTAPGLGVGPAPADLKSLAMAAQA